MDIHKAFAKIQHPFLIKTINKVKTEGSTFNLIKTVYEKLTSRFMIKYKRQNVFP